MAKLYWSADRPQYWIAALDDGKWVQFPVRPGGWGARKPAFGLDPLRMREVPSSQAFDAGFPYQVPPLAARAVAAV